MSLDLATGSAKAARTRTCAHCGNVFARPRLGPKQWGATRYCSVDCGNKSRTSHGMRASRLYRVWAGIKNRCLNKNDPLFQEYGARGITICDEWRDDFYVFATYQVGRIDNERGYEPGNVRWETRTQNMRNKRSTHWVDMDGERICLKEACERRGVGYKKVHLRITRYGWSLERALS
jgi:hypothetical protein